MAPIPAEIRFTERLLAFMDGNLPTLPGDSPIRLIAEECAAALARRSGLPGPGMRQTDADLADASAEIEARLAEAGARPLDALTAAQWSIVGAGIPLSLDELRDGAEDCAARWLPLADGHSVETIAVAFHSAGILKGALVQSWRR